MQANQFQGAGQKIAKDFINLIKTSKTGSQPTRAIKQYMQCDRPNAMLEGYDSRLLLSKSATVFSYTFHVPPLITFGISISIGVHCIDYLSLRQLRLPIAS